MQNDLKEFATASFPHRAIISFQAEIMGVRPDGGLDGKPRGKMVNKIFTILGSSYTDCSDKLTSLLKVLENETE